MEIFFKKGIVILIFLNFFYIQAQSDYNKLDEKGNKNGLWKGIYNDTKNPKYEGTFDHGKEVGIFTFFDNKKTKIVIATREFNSKDNAAYNIFYDQLKNKLSEGKVVHKLYEGQWKYYHKASKAIMTIENYTNGKLEGLRSVFYPNGKIAEEIVYKNNLKNGLYKRYTVSGIIIEDSNYKNNQYDGIAVFRDADSGAMVSKGKFTNGKKTGLWQFFENGEVVKEMNMSYPENTAKAKK